MTKIVLNGCYGGFGLSDVALARYAELTGTAPCDVDPYELERTDPALVQAVEELGSRANDSGAKLYVKDIPPGTRYRVVEYDGIEAIETESAIEWSIA